MIELPSPCLVVLVGPAGSGKTTWAAQHFPGRVVGSDAFRALVGEGEDDLRASRDAFALLDDVIDRRLRRGLTTVVDTLGNEAVRRDAWRRLASRHGVPCHAVVVATSATDVRRWNKARPKRVPDAVLRAQLAAADSVGREVAAEPFDGVHTVTPDAVAMLVAPSLTRTRSRDVAPAPSSTDRPLTFGLQISQFTWPDGPAGIGPHLREVARRAEAAGFARST